MATIRATVKRIIRYAEYETEALELSVEREPMGVFDEVKEAALLYQSLADAVDILAAERLAANGKSKRPTAGVASAIISPDPYSQ